MVALVVDPELGDVGSIRDILPCPELSEPVVASAGFAFLVESFWEWMIPLVAFDVDAASTPLPSFIEVSVVTVFSKPTELSATL